MRRGKHDDDDDDDDDNHYTKASIPQKTTTALCKPQLTSLDTARKIQKQQHLPCFLSEEMTVK